VVVVEVVVVEVVVVEVVVVEVVVVEVVYLIRYYKQPSILKITKQSHKAMLVF
jgi:hypothetical protein